MVQHRKKGACAENQPSQLEEDAWKVAACSGGKCRPVFKCVCATTGLPHNVQCAYLKEQCVKEGDSLTQPLLGRHSCVSDTAGQRKKRVTLMHSATKQIVFDSEDFKKWFPGKRLRCLLQRHKSVVKRLTSKSPS